MDAPTIFIVKPAHIKRKSLEDTLRDAIATEFAGRNYLILNEFQIERSTSYSQTPRKFKAFLIEEGAKKHSIYFDITDVCLVNNY